MIKIHARYLAIFPAVKAVPLIKEMAITRYYTKNTEIVETPIATETYGFQLIEIMGY